MWYAVQTPTGREAEMAEKLNRVYSGESDKPCFVLSKERSWRMGGIYHIGVEPMFPGYIFVDTDDAGELEQKIGILAGSAKLPLDEKAVPLEKAEEDFLKRLLREDPQHTVRRFLVQVNEAGELVSAEGILGESLGQIVRKRIRKRVVTLEIPMLGAARRVELAMKTGSRWQAYEKFRYEVFRSDACLPKGKSVLFLPGGAQHDETECFPG